VDNNQQSRFDDAFRQKLREIPVPVGLRTRILASAPAKRAPRFWPWLVPGFAVVVLALVVWFARADHSFAGYRREMIRSISTEYKIDLRADNFDEIRQGLAEHGYPADYVLPAGLKNISVEGSCLRRWHGQKVSLVCMEAKGHDVWLFLIESRVLPNAPPTSPVFAKTGNITNASWIAGHLIYILATQGEEAELRTYL
jgi:hypothetical protein